MIYKSKISPVFIPAHPWVAGSEQGTGQEGDKQVSIALGTPA